MYDQEKKQASYLTLLLCYTCFLAVLTVESALMGWSLGAMVRLWAGLIVCWAVYISRKVPDDVKKWLFFLVTMAAFLFYGLHETSFYDMAAVMSGIIVIYYAAGMYGMIGLCMAVYYAAMLGSMTFVMRGSLEFTPLTVSRILLHFGIVFLVGRLTKMMADRREREESGIGLRIAELEEMNRRTEDFLTNVSHELRTPINAVTGLTAVMLKGGDGAAYRDNLLSVQKAGHRLFRQVEDILDFTEIDTKRITVSEEDYMISLLVNDIASESWLLEGKENLELIFDMDAEIPAVLHGDSRKIKKIIRHLLENAVKFTDEGGCCVRIYCLKKPYGINLCIRVTDTGAGMTGEDLEKITEKFYQSSGGRARRAGGLGIGIPIVYGMAAAMDGFVHIESSVGTGTTVTVSIPQKVVNENRCMAVEDPKSLCLACYLRPEKYQVPGVRTFYDEMISHIASGLEISVHRVFNTEELEKLNSTYRLTHLFLAKEEYEENLAWFEELDREIQVVLVAQPDYALPAGSRVKLLPKPFSCFPVVNILNAAGEEKDGERQASRMLCPDIRILVVDDEPMNRMVAEGIFRDYGMQVKTAGSGREAIEICGKEDFDLIFLDHMMPQMDGVETLHHLRRLKTDSSRPLTAVAFTANAVSGAREMFLREGFDEFVSKPIETSELERVLRKLLPKARIQYVDQNAAWDRERTAMASAEDAVQEAAAPEKGGPAGKGQDPLAAFRDMGISVDQGLSYCRGDQAFYLNMMTMYGQEAEQKSADLQELYEKRDYENYRIQVHALKSTSRLVGVELVSERAKELEDAAKKSDAGYMEEHHQDLLDLYRETADRIREILEPEESGAKEQEMPEAEEDGKNGISGEELLACLDGLQESLDTYEQDKARSLIGELGGRVWDGRELRALLRDVERSVEEFEFEAAAEALEALRAQVRGGGAG